MDIVSRIGEQFGVDAGMLPKLTTFVEMVVAAPLNLTAWTEQLIWTEGVVQSLELASLFPKSSGRALDIGTGGGFPGLVLAITHPLWHWTLLDARKRRTEFLRKVMQTLELDNVEVVTDRAEEWIRRDDQRRESFDMVTMRAVANPSGAVELALPYVRLEGIFLAVHGFGGREDMEHGAPLVEALGGHLVRWVALATGERSGTVAVIRKASPTPLGYPRRAKSLGKPMH